MQTILEVIALNKDKRGQVLGVGGVVEWYIYLVVSIAITAVKAGAAVYELYQNYFLLGTSVRGRVLWDGISSGVYRYHCRQGEGCGV